MEVGGRWSDETRSFVSQLVRARARHETAILQKRAEQAWRMRWGSMLSCVAAKAVATSLLVLRCAHGSDGDTFSTSEVEGEHRHAGGGDRLRPISTSANSISANFWTLNFGTTKCGALEGWAPKGGGPKPRKSVAQKGGAPKGGEPKISRFFFHTPATIFFLLSSLGVRSWNFGGV